MNIAGKYLSIAQSTAESALLAPLRAKHKLNLNLVTLANEAKEELQQFGLPINPTNLLNTADTIADRQATMIQDTIGLEQERWNPVLRRDETYITPDPRKDFRR
jgi:hypothetical protein